jgi:hypothetical protein
MILKGCATRKQGFNRYIWSFTRAARAQIPFLPAFSCVGTPIEWPPLDRTVTKCDAGKPRMAKLRVCQASLILYPHPLPFYNR